MNDPRIKGMVDAFPYPQPDPDDDEAVEVYARRLVMWAKAHDPEGFAAHWEAFGMATLTSDVEEVLEAEVEAGRMERVIDDHGDVVYRRLSAP